MAKVLEALIAKGRRAKRPREQKEVAFGLADLSTHRESPPLLLLADPSTQSRAVVHVDVAGGVGRSYRTKHIQIYSNNV